MSLRLSDHNVFHNIASSSSFFRFRSAFLASFARISYFKFFAFKEFNKTIIPFALVGYESGYSQRGATRLVGYLLESWRSTKRRQRQRHKFCIFNEAKQKLCTPFTFLFHFCTFLSRSLQICDVKWHFSSFTENVNTQPPIWIFFPGFYTAPLNSVPG